VAIVGPLDDSATQALHRAAFGHFDPAAVYAFAAGPDDEAAERVPLLAGKALVGGRPAAYVCQNFACLAPVTEPEALTEALTAEPIRRL
jgi:uncharacterized protein YyaL (SSP411 family)